MIVKPKPTVNFVFSYPYEGTLLKLTKTMLTDEYGETARKKVKIAQKIWNRYESQILKLFEEIYKTKITETYIKAYVSLALPDSYSDPLTLSLKYWPDIETNDRSKRAFVYSVIHELAHYFSYTRYPYNFFNKLFIKIQKTNLLGSHGKNMHYLIQAVEFGIIGEVFGETHAEYSRNWAIENFSNTEYGQSAKELREHRVPLDKSCLDYIYKNILKQDKS